MYLESENLLEMIYYFLKVSKQLCVVWILSWLAPDQK